MYPSISQIQVWAQTNVADPVWVTSFASQYGRLPHDIGELVASGVQPNPNVVYPPAGAKVNPTPPIGFTAPKLDLTTVKSVAGPIVGWVASNPITVPVAVGLGYLALVGGRHRRRHFGI